MSFTLDIERKFNASQEKVFQAWTNPEFLMKWWRSAPDWSPSKAEVELKEGGHYNLGMKDPEGVEHVVGGTFKKVKPHDELEYTWKWVDGENTTLVNVKFIPDGDGCLLKLNHTKFVEQQHCDLHKQGWDGCLDGLNLILNL